MENKSLTLAIETGINGGSLALIKNDSEIDSWEGSQAVSKAEDLLAVISDLLLKNSLEKRDINLIAVSRGPGSFTGLRIGLATARGLSSAFGCRCAGVSVLEAMASSLNESVNVISAFSLNKNEVCWQMFEIENTGDLRPITKINQEKIQSFFNEIETIKDTKVIICKSLYKNLLEFYSAGEGGCEKYFKLECNTAYYVGLRAKTRASISELDPIYMRDSRPDI